MNLTLLAARLAVCRLPGGAAVPGWAMSGPMWSVTGTGDELSIICVEELLPGNPPPEMKIEGGWRCLKVAGPLDFSLTGILAGLTGCLAGAQVPVFAFSTFDTDYIMIKDGDLEKALAALGAAGHRIDRPQE